MAQGSLSSRVIALMRRQRVCTVAWLQERLQVARVSVFRGLRAYGYFCSCNANGRYLTLKDTPRFDRDGIWGHGRLRFSRHGTLAETIAVLIPRSASGLTVTDLRQRLNTRVHNQLSALCRQDRVGRYRVGRTMVYVSADPEQAARQRRERQQEAQRLALKPAPLWREGEVLPEGMPAQAAIAVLVRLLETPEASPASIAKSLQHRGVRVNAEQVRKVLTFYGIEKKGS